MNALQISNALKRDPIVKEKFVGVFSSNNLPVKEYPGAYIANPDASKQPGMHWVAFVTNHPGVIEAFDFLGRNPAIYSDHLSQWMDDEVSVMSSIQR